MVQTQPTEKLHAACDECRTRKLKCSGGTPKCVRCAREGIQCVYSPQKQMGRPRKRRREGDVDDAAESSPENQLDQSSDPSEMPIASNHPKFDLITPPESLDRISSNGSTSNEPLTPSHFDIDPVRAFRLSPIPNLDMVVDPTIDPSIWNAQPTTYQPNTIDTAAIDLSTLGSCTCLSVMYLTLTDLQGVTSFSFPQVIIPLRKAMSTLDSLIHCTECPKENFTAIQNVQSVAALFKAIIERFSKVLRQVDVEAAHLEQTGQKKPFRVGDNSPGLMHLHTGTLDCPMGFNVELESKDWRRLVKTALRTEVYGGGSNMRPLTDLLREADTRQAAWHKIMESMPQENQLFPGSSHHHHHTGESCETLGAPRLRAAMDNLSWD